MLAASMSDWEGEAENWVRWARTPGHDSYWHYSHPFFEAVVPPPGRRTLDLGCGEGRVARDLAGLGHVVLGVDVSPTMVRFAEEADPDGHYLVADASRLPLPNESFDLVVAYNSLMDMDDMPSAVREAARVLEPGGRLCVSVTHPVNDAGAFVGDGPDATFEIKGSYFGPRRFEQTEQRDGIAVTFRGWVYSFQDYAEALERAGLLIETIREPPAPPAAVEQRPAYQRWQRIPIFLQFRALKAT
jgi:SAM-dependent methyltransferase